MVVEAVTAEGPVHIDEITDRIRNAWGLKRTGARISEVVANAAAVAVRLGRVEQSGSFLSMPGAMPIPRDRSMVESPGLRKPEMLPPAELAEAAVLVVRRSFGASRDQVIQAIARGIGVKSTSAQMRDAIDQAVADALTAGRMTDEAGLLQVRA